MRTLIILLLLCSLGCGAQKTFGEYIPNVHTIGYWRFNETSGDIAVDASGNVDGVCSGTEWVLGRFGGNGIRINSINDSVWLETTNMSFSTNSAFTISVWVYANTITNSISFFQKYDPYNAAGYYVGAGYGSLIFERAFGFSKRNRIRYGGLNSINFLTGYWFNVIATCEGGSDASSMKLYVNGIDSTTIVENTWNGYDMVNSWWPVIGHQNGLGSIQIPDFKIDELIIETRAWSGTQVRNYYTYTKGRFARN